VLRYLVIIEKGEQNYGAYAPDVPGCVATGQTVDEVRARMQEALAFHLESMAADGEPMPEPSSEAVYVEVQLPASSHDLSLDIPALASKDITKLTAHELWALVRALEGKSIYTLVKRSPNLIEEVTNSEIKIRGRRSAVPRWQVNRGFEQLTRTGELLVKKRHSPDTWTLFVVPALLYVALGEDRQLELIPGNAGIRLKDKRALARAS
jgi:predicted RNase H-like HicB family nuclease